MYVCVSVQHIRTIDTSMFACVSLFSQYVQPVDAFVCVSVQHRLYRDVFVSVALFLFCLVYTISRCVCLPNMYLLSMCVYLCVSLSVQHMRSIWVSLFLCMFARVSCVFFVNPCVLTLLQNFKIFSILSAICFHSRF